LSCLANPLTESLPIFDSSLANPAHWYAVYTYPRHEKTVAEHLEAKAIEAFLPAFETVNRWKDRRVKIQTPVFPGYVFTRIHLNERSKVFSIPGVVRLLSFNGAPAPIDDSEIEAVRLCVERGVNLETCSLVDVGDRVRVKSGVLEGLEGLVSRCKNERRLIVPISLINQSVAVEVDVRLLEPISNRDVSQYRYAGQWA
jgi:transcription antitermination factor NusG